MSNFVDINKDFIKRTIELLTQFEKLTNREVTLLINSCLGLIGVPSEKQREEPVYEGLFKKKLTGLYKEPDKWGIEESFCDIPLCNCSDKRKTEGKCDCGTLSYLTRRIRNGICHLHIHTIPDDNDQIKTLIIEDRPNKNTDFDFKIELPVANLRKFALALANEILSIEKAKY